MCRATFLNVAQSKSMPSLAELHLRHEAARIFDHRSLVDDERRPIVGIELEPIRARARDVQKSRNHEADVAAAPGEPVDVSATRKPDRIDSGDALRPPVASRGAENTCGQRLCLEQGAPPGLQADTSERERDTGNGEGNAAFERLRASIEDEKDEGGDDEKPHG